jgi:diguanylate cyclase (GGDEF)-like protein
MDNERLATTRNSWINKPEISSNLLECKIMLVKHLCPCCSQPLLLHISYKRNFWFCRHCHQEMPDLESLRETQLESQHWLSTSITERKQLKEVLQQREQLSSRLETKNELQCLASSYSLTQLANRLRFKAYIEQDWQRMAREQAPLSLILGNLDYFKTYNDTYGYQVGDWCLQGIAEAIIHVLKYPSELVPRYGGEEFIVILPKTKAEDAVQIAEDIRASVKALKIASANSQFGQYLTLSLGVASLVPTPKYSSEMLMKVAERALHRAKKQGRDRVILGETLQRQTKVIAEKIFALPQADERTPVLVGVEHKGADTKTERLMSYVAYYVSLGKTVVSPLSGPLSYQKSVYQYWGYHKDFWDFWKQLTSRRDFPELYIESDVYCFGQFLEESCTVGKCDRCNLPIPKSEGHAYDVPNCNLCDWSLLSHQGNGNSVSQNVEDELGVTQVVAIGTPPTDGENLEEWFALNGFQVTFVSHQEDIASQSLPRAVDLVLIYGSVSEAEGKAWAQKLSRYPQCKGVPIVALSDRAGGGLPWMERRLGLDDYVLPPYGGDRIAYHLRHLLKPQMGGDTAELYWFPC